MYLRQPHSGKSLNASSTSSSHLRPKSSQPTNLHIFITSSLFNVLAACDDALYKSTYTLLFTLLALHLLLALLGYQHCPRWNNWSLRLLRFALWVFGINCLCTSIFVNLIPVNLFLTHQFLHLYIYHVFLTHPLLIHIITPSLFHSLPVSQTFPRTAFTAITRTVSP